MIIPPILKGKPNLKIGTVYLLKLTKGTAYAFKRKHSSNETINLKTDSVLLFLEFKYIIKDGHYVFDFLAGNEIISYSAYDDLADYICNFEELV